MSADPILYERVTDRVAVLTFNRPEVLNAVNQATIERFNELLAETDRDPGLRAIVLTGKGRAFSAGADLKEYSSTLGAATLRDAVRGLDATQEITRRFVAHHAVFVAALNGIAVGIGAELSLNADLRIGCDASELYFSEAKRGLFQTNGVMHLLPRIVGQGRAAHWLLTSERIKAPALLAGGFLSELVPQDQLVARAIELASMAAANAPVSVTHLKKLLRRTWEVDLETMLQLEIDGMMACMASEDAEEGVRAFGERREPRWLGR
ncbi:MAG: enoyl-CoA hydratase/isomerase family protein [Gemmatimonadota bacterium]